MKPLAVSRLATARSLYTSASYFLSFGTISPAELSSHDRVWQVCEDSGKSSRRRRKRRAGAYGGCLHSTSDLLGALLGEAAFVGPNTLPEEGVAHKTGLTEAQATSDCRFASPEFPAGRRGARRRLSFDLGERLIAAAPLSLFIS